MADETTKGEIQIDEAEVKKMLTNIPNNVNNDGKMFVTKLKEYLKKLGLLTDQKISDNNDELTEKPTQVTNVALTEEHSVSDGSRVNTILVEWNKTSVENYAKAEVWYKVGGDGEWTKAGESAGTQYRYNGAATGSTYYIKVVSVNAKGNAAEFDEAPQASISIKGDQYIPSAPTQFVLTWDEQGPLWEWLFEDNGYVDFFELRLDKNPGVWNDKRLDSTRETTSRVNPNVRSGTAYLYIRNIFGEYSEPAVHDFSKAMGSKPDIPTLTATLDGVNIKMAGLPAGYTNYKVQVKTVNGDDVTGDEFITTNDVFIYFFFSGTISVRYCFMDDIGEGEWSDVVTANVKDLIVSADNIAEGAVTTDKLAANAVTAAKISANAITADKINSGAITADKIEAGAITAEKLAADSVTSNAIQAGSVIGDKIAANSITTSKLASANIDLTGALTITGGNVKLSEEGLRLTNSDGSYTLFNQDGINYTDTSGIIYSQIKKMIMGIAYDGQYIKFASAWPQAPQVLVSPTSLLVNSADYSQNNIFIVCTATDITTTGFKVNCYSCLGTDTQGMVTINKSVTNYQVTGAGRQYTFLTFTIVVPATAGSITVTGYAHNVPWNSSDGDGYNKGHGVSNFYAEITGDGVTSCEKYHYGENTDADKSEWAANFSVTAKLSGATQVTFKAYGSSTDTNNWSGSYGSTGGLSISIPSATFDIAGDTIVSRGYANFIAIDSTNNTYNIQTTVKVLINYNGSPLALKTVYVDGTAYTTDSSGYIEITGTSSKECVFAYSTAPTTTQTVTFSDGTITTVNISPADVTCYLRVTYDGTVITSGTVSVNGADMTPDSSGKIEIGGKDGDTGTYTVAYGNDSMTVTVTYTAASITTIALVSITDGSTTYTSDGTVTFTVPGGITRIQAVAEVYIADGPMGEEVNYSCTITDTANSTEWGYGYSNSDFEEEGNTSHGNMNSVIAVTPNKQYSLKIEGTSDCTSGIKLSWGKDINKLTADVTDT